MACPGQWLLQNPMQKESGVKMHLNKWTKHWHSYHWHIISKLYHALSHHVFFAFMSFNEPTGPWSCSSWTVRRQPTWPWSHRASDQWFVTGSTHLCHNNDTSGYFWLPMASLFTSFHGICWRSTKNKPPGPISMKRIEDSTNDAKKLDTTQSLVKFVTS